MKMFVGNVKLNRFEVFIEESFIDPNSLNLKIMSPEALDSIIEQCRDIKLKLMEEKS